MEFPDLERCQSYSDTLEETMSNAQEALGLYIASKLDNNEEINKPSDIKKALKAETVLHHMFQVISANIERKPGLSKRH